jgi:hypothetical protein
MSAMLTTLLLDAARYRSFLARKCSACIVFMQRGFRFEEATPVDSADGVEELALAHIEPLGAPYKASEYVLVQPCVVAGAQRLLVLKDLGVLAASHRLEASALAQLGAFADKPLATMTELIALMVTPEQRLLAMYSAVDWQATQLAEDLEACLSTLENWRRMGRHRHIQVRHVRGDVRGAALPRLPGHQRPGGGAVRLFSA